MMLKVKAAENMNMARREAIVIFISKKNMKMAKRQALLVMTLILFMSRVMSDHLRMFRHFDFK